MAHSSVIIYIIWLYIIKLSLLELFDYIYNMYKIYL